MQRGLATGLVMLVVGLGLGRLRVDLRQPVRRPGQSFIAALPEIADDALAWFNRVTGSNFTFDTILGPAGHHPG